MPSIIGPALRHSPRGYIYGFEVQYSSATALTCTGGYCRDAADKFDIDATTMPNFDITLTGAGGRRSGLVEAADTFYHCFVIADSRRINAPTSFIDSTLVPTLPSGYDSYRRVFTVRNNSSSNFRDFNQVRIAGATREIHYRIGESTAQILASGTAASMTSVSLTTFMPTTATVAYIKAKIDAPGDSDTVRWRPNVDASSGVTTPPLRTFGGDTQAGNSVATDTFYIYCPDRIIQYQVVPAGAWTTYVDAWILGYVDNL